VHLKVHIKCTFNLSQRLRIINIKNTSFKRLLEKGEQEGGGMRMR
jgi:hypothetical protein